MGASASSEHVPFSLWELRVVKRAYTAWQTKHAMRFGLSRPDLVELLEGVKGEAGGAAAAWLWDALLTPESATAGGTAALDSSATPLSRASPALSLSSSSSPGRRRPKQIDALGVFSVLAVYANAAFDDKLRMVFSFFDFDHDDRLATDEFAILTLSTVCALRAAVRRAERPAALGSKSSAGTSSRGGAETSPLFTASPAAVSPSFNTRSPAKPRLELRAVRRQCEKFVAGGEFGMSSNSSIRVITALSITWVDFRQYVKTALDHDNDATAETVLGHFETPDTGEANRQGTDDTGSVMSFGSGDGGYRATVHRPTTWLNAVMKRRFREYEAAHELTALQFAQATSEAAAEGHSSAADGRRPPAQFVPWEGAAMIQPVLIAPSSTSRGTAASLLDAATTLSLRDRPAAKEPPVGRLELEWVHGTADGGRDDVRCIGSGEALFPCGECVVVFDMQIRTQRFFRGHTDRVTSIAVHPLNRVVVASGQAVLRRRRRDRHSIAVPSDGASVMIWDAISLEPSALIDPPELCGRVSALAWSDDGTVLVAVGDDSNHIAFLTRVPIDLVGRRGGAAEKGEACGEVPPSPPPCRLEPFATVSLGLTKVMSVSLLDGINYVGAAVESGLIFARFTEVDSSNSSSPTAMASVCERAVFKDPEGGGAVAVKKSRLRNSSMDAQHCYAIAEFGGYAVVGGKDGSVGLWTRCVSDRDDRAVRPYWVCEKKVRAGFSSNANGNPIVSLVVASVDQLIIAADDGRIFCLDGEFAPIGRFDLGTVELMRYPHLRGIGVFADLERACGFVLMHTGGGELAVVRYTNGADDLDDAMVFDLEENETAGKKLKTAAAGGGGAWSDDEEEYVSEQGAPVANGDDADHVHQELQDEQEEEEEEEEEEESDGDSERDAMRRKAAEFSPAAAAAQAERDSRAQIKDAGGIDLKRCAFSVPLRSHFFGDVWSLATSPTRPHAATVGDDGYLRVWDTSKHLHIVSSEAFETVARAVCYSPDGDLIAVGLGGNIGTWCSKSGMGVIKIFPWNAKEVLVEVSDVVGGVGALSYSPNGEILAAGGDDANVYIYQCAESDARLVRVLGGHSGPVVSIDFSSDSAKMRSNCATNELRYWNASSGEELPPRASAAALGETLWASATCAVSWETQGAWSRSGPGNCAFGNPAAVHQNPDRSLIATVDAGGRLRVFDSPCSREGQSCVEVTGPAAAIRSVRWSFDGSSVIAVGGQSVFQWRNKLVPSHVANDGVGTESGAAFKILQRFAVEEEESGAEMTDTMEESRGRSVGGRVQQRTLGDRPTPKDFSLDPNRRALGVLATKRKDAGIAPYDALSTVPHAVAKACRKLKAPTQCPVPATKAPQVAMTLEWAYGVNSRAGAYSSSEGDIVYTVGAVAVLYSPQWNEQRHFCGHSERIAALAVSANGSTAATATVRLDTPILIWDVSTLQVRAQCNITWPESETTVHIVQALSFTPDAATLVCCFRIGVRGSGVATWDTRTGSCTAHFISAEMDLRCAVAINMGCVAYSPRLVHRWVFSPPSRTLVRCAVEPVPVPSDEEVTITPQLGDFCSIAATPEGDRVVLGTTDGSLVVYERGKDGSTLALQSILVDAHMHCIVATLIESKSALSSSPVLWSGDSSGVLMRWELPIQNIAEGAVVVFEAHAEGGGPVSIGCVAASVVPAARVGEGSKAALQDDSESVASDALTLGGGVLVTTSDGRIVECSLERAEATELVMNQGVGRAPAVAVYFSDNVEHAPERQHGRQRSPRSPAKGPQPTIFAAGGGDGCVRLYNIDTHDIAVQSEWLGIAINGLSFNFDGALLAVARPAFARDLSSSSGDDDEGEDMDEEAKLRVLSDNNVAGTEASWCVIDGETLGVVFSPTTEPGMCTGGGGRAVAFAPDGSALAIACEDASIILIGITKGYKNAGDAKWAVRPKFAHIKTLRGHKSPVAQIDWSADGMYMRSNGSTPELRFWDMKKLKKLKSGPKIAKDVPWASVTCSMAWETQGVWSSERHGDEDVPVQINAVDAAPHSNLVAAVGQHGVVHLFSLPCALLDAGFDSLTAICGGHGAIASVTGVAWSSDGQQLLTSAHFTDEFGELASSLMQWDVIETAAILEKAHRTVQDDVMSTGGENDLLASFVRHFRVADEFALSDQAENSTLKAAKISPAMWDCAKRAARGGTAFDFAAVSEAAADECLAPQPWIGAIKEPSRPPPVISEPPDVDVELEWVHGYAGLGYSNNVVAMEDGHVLVYPVAALVVVYNERRHSQRHFRGHREEVTALAAHPLDLDLVVSGEAGDAPQIFIWNVRTLVTVAVIEGVHTSNVRCLAFSICGRYLGATGDVRRHVDTARTGCGSGWDRLVLYRWRDSPTPPPCDRALRNRMQCPAAVMPIGVSESRLSRAMAIAFTPDSKQLVAVGDGMLRFFSIVDANWTWGGKSGIMKGDGISAHTLNNARNQMFLSLCCGEQCTAVGTLSGHVYIWTNDTHLLVRVVRLGGRPVYSMVLDRAAHRMWVGDHKGAVYSVDRWEEADRIAAVHHAVFALNSMPGADTKAGAGSIRAVVLASPAPLLPRDAELVTSISITTTLVLATKGAELWRIALKEEEAEALDVSETDFEDTFGGGGVGGEDDGSPKSQSAATTVQQLRWDVTSEVCLGRGHCRGEVWGLAVHPIKWQCITAGDDGYVRLWDCEKHVQIARSAHWDARVRSAAFNHDGSVVVIGFGGALGLDTEVGRKDGQVKILDFNPEREEEETPTSGTASSRRSIASRKGNRALQSRSGMKSSRFTRRPPVDRTFKLMAERHDAKGSIRDIQFSRKSRYLAVASSDKLIYLYDARDNAFEKIGQCRGHLSFVTRIDFSNDEQYMRTNCNDGDLLYWTCSSAHNIPGGVSQLRDVDWGTERCPYVWGTKGVHSVTADGVKAACVHRSHSRSLMVVGTNFGGVRVHSWPCVQQGVGASPAQHPHSSGITNISWSRDDGHLISLGRDGAIMVWRVEGHDRHSVMFASALADKEIPDVSGSNGRIDGELVSESSVNALGTLPSGRRIGNFAVDAATERPSGEAPWLDSLTPPTLPPVENLGANNSARMLWVHGVDTTASRDAVRFTPEGDLLYATASLGVKRRVFGSQRQQYNHALERRIACLALSSNGALAATGESICGELESIARRPKVALWSAQTMRTKAVLDSSHCSSVAVLRFSPDDSALLSIGTDTQCRIAMYCTRTHRHLLSTNGRGAHPGAIISAAFAPQGSADEMVFTTVGVDGHLVFWIGRRQASSRRRRAPSRSEVVKAAPAAANVSDAAEMEQHGGGNRGGGDGADDGSDDEDGSSVGETSGASWVFRSRRGHIAKQGGKFQAFLSVEWSSPTVCIVGVELGDLYVFESHQLVRKIQAHSEPVRMLRRGGPRNDVLLSSADDGCLLAWRARTLTRLKGVPLASSAGASVRSAAFSRFGLGSVHGGDGSTAGDLLVATANGQVAQIKEWVVQFAVNPKSEREALVHAHPRGAVNAVAVHPVPELCRFASGGERGAVRLWQLRGEHVLVASADLGSTSCVDALDFSPNDEGAHLAVALHRANGDAYLRVLSGTTLEKEEKRRLGTGRVTAVRFSPSGATLVSTCEDGGIYVADVADGMYMKASLLRPTAPGDGALPPAFVARFDFSLDGRLLRTNDTTVRRVGYWALRGESGTPEELALVATNDAMRDEEWSRWSCPYAWALSNSHSTAANRGAVTAAARAKEGRRGAPLLATGDDEGCVRLWHWPCATAAAAQLGEALVGHGCAITDLVTANSGDSSSHLEVGDGDGWSSLLLSAGGLDGSVIVWSVVE